MRGFLHLCCSPTAPLLLPCHAVLSVAFFVPVDVTQIFRNVPFVVFFLVSEEVVRNNPWVTTATYCSRLEEESGEVVRPRKTRETKPALHTSPSVRLLSLLWASEKAAEVACT